MKMFHFPSLKISVCVRRNVTFFFLNEEHRFKKEPILAHDSEGFFLYTDVSLGNVIGTQLSAPKEHL